MIISARHIGAIIAAGVLAALAGAAQAAGAPPKAMDFTVRTESAAGPASGAKTLKWDARRGRWGVTLDLQQLDTRESTWGDVQAGAYYRITPSLRVGGAVALGDQQVIPGPQKFLPDQGQPRVRLETQFKF